MNISPFYIKGPIIYVLLDIKRVVALEKKKFFLCLNGFKIRLQPKFNLTVIRAYITVSVN